MRKKHTKKITITHKNYCLWHQKILVLIFFNWFFLYFLFYFNIIFVIAIFRNLTLIGIKLFFSIFTFFVCFLFLLFFLCFSFVVVFCVSVLWFYFVSQFFWVLCFVVSVLVNMLTKCYKQKKSSCWQSVTKKRVFMLTFVTCRVSPGLSSWEAKKKKIVFWCINYNYIQY